MGDFDLSLDLGDEAIGPSVTPTNQDVSERLRPCEHKCQHCGGDVVYYDDGDWRRFTCMGCKSMSPLSPAALILSTKDKPSKARGQFFKRLRAEKRRAKQ